MKITLFIFSISISLMTLAQSNRTEKDQFGEMKVPSNADYGINAARAIKHLNLGNDKLADYPILIEALNSVKLAAIEVNAKNGSLPDEKTVFITRASRALSKSGKSLEAFDFDLRDGSNGFYPNAVINEVLTNMALEISGTNKGNYKVIDPTKDLNLNQNFQAVYQTALNLSIYLRNELLLKELENFQKSLDEITPPSTAINLSNTMSQPALGLMQSKFEQQKDTLKIHISKLQNLAMSFKFHTLNGSVGYEENAGKSTFSSEFSSMIHKTTAVNMYYENPKTNLDKHLIESLDYIDALDGLSSFVIETTTLLQVLNTKVNTVSPFIISNFTEQGTFEPIIPKMVKQNCMIINGLHYSLSQNLDNKKQYSSSDLSQICIEVTASQQILLKAIKKLRYEYSPRTAE